MPRTPAIRRHRASQGRELRRHRRGTARRPGARVAIIGAGGIGFDVAEFLTHAGAADGHASDGALHDPAITAFRDEWGIDATYARPRRREAGRMSRAPPRNVWLLQRKSTKVGDGLAKTTGMDPPYAAEDGAA